VTFAVGLTGGIGSGKSTVADAFAHLGIDVTDTDRLAHALTAPGTPGHAAIRAAFGGDCFRDDGSLDRGRLRQQVFADASLRQRLEWILHPLIRAAAATAMAGWRSPYGILVVPLLFERGGGLRDVVQRVLVVDCPEPVQIERTMARSGIAEADVRAIMATQWPRARRLERADDVITNAGAPAELDAQCERTHRKYLEMAAISR